VRASDYSTRDLYGMTLHELLSSHQSGIARRWLEKTLATYPRDAARLMARQKDQFANPVGHTLAVGTAAIVPLLIDAPDPEALRQHLEPMIKIRAVQDFSAADAVGFVYLLKSAIRDELGGELHDLEMLEALMRFEDRIDRLALLCFDLYAQTRDRLAQVRINEINRRVSKRWERAYPDTPAPGRGGPTDPT